MGEGVMNVQESGTGVADTVHSDASIEQNGDTVSKPHGGVSDTGKGKSVLPYVNLRIFLFCAVGAAAGIFAYIRIRFGGFRASDLIFLPVLLVPTLFPVCRRRAIVLGVCLLLFGSVGAGSMHLYTQRYESGPSTGVYKVTGTVCAFAVSNGYTYTELRSVTLGGERVGGKLGATLPSDRVRPGDVVTFTARVVRLSADPDSREFTEDVRYVSYPSEYLKTGDSPDPFLRLNGHLYDVLHDGMRHHEEADIAFALLTGNSRMADGGFMDGVRKGGIAHIFAVSGLHIGILFGAMSLVFRFLKKYAFLPALLFALAYCALCGFSVSCLRALLMCAVLSLNTFFGRKNDLLQSTGLAALAALTVFPAQFSAVGFRLSFGACVGLGLFSGSLGRLFSKLRIPRFFGELLAASLAVQIFTFPVLIEYFGYFPLWGLLLNLILAPLLPFAFLTLLLCTLIALIVPPAAGFFLILPEGLFSALLTLFSVGETGGLLCGFSLGTGAVVWLTATVVLSERFRMARTVRILCASLGIVLFGACLLAENAVFLGCRVNISGNIALVRTRECAVLIVGDTSPAQTEDFLLRTYTGKLDAAILLSSESASVGAAVYSGAEAAYFRTPLVTGFRERELTAAETVELGGMYFRYEKNGKLMLAYEDCTVEFDFSDGSALSPDLFADPAKERLNYLLVCGIMVAL